MNDAELDQLLAAWEAPAAPPSLRNGLKARFPRAERRSFVHPLRWVLVIVAASLTFAIAMEQTGENPWGFGLVRALHGLHDHLWGGLQAWRATSIAAQIRQSEPKVYVDGELVGPLEYGPAATMNVQVPGEGLYSITAYRGRLDGWVRAGHIHGNVIEFQAGSKQVRIECNQPIIDSDRPVLARRRQ